jgi:hypothetical protein
VASVFLDVLFCFVSRLIVVLDLCLSSLTPYDAFLLEYCESPNASWLLDLIRMLANMNVVNINIMYYL